MNESTIDINPDRDILFMAIGANDDLGKLLREIQSGEIFEDKSE